MKVGEVISSAEFTGCIVVDQLCDEIPVTKENCSEIYDREVEHIDATGGLVRIWTFDNLDKVGLTEADYDKYVRANPQWDLLMKAIFVYISMQVGELYGPFDYEFEFVNNTFVIKSTDEIYFECDPVKLYLRNDGFEVFVRMGYDSPGIYSLVLERCIKSLEGDYE